MKPANVGAVRVPRVDVPKDGVTVGEREGRLEGERPQVQILLDARCLLESVRPLFLPVLASAVSIPQN